MFYTYLEVPMKNILVLTAIFAILAASAIGCLMIFEVYSFDQGTSFLLKALAVIFLLGAASAVIALIVRDKGAQKE